MGFWLDKLFGYRRLRYGGKDDAFFLILFLFFLFFIFVDFLLIIVAYTSRTLGHRDM